LWWFLMTNTNLSSELCDRDFWTCHDPNARPALGYCMRFSSWITVITIVNLVFSYSYSNADADELTWGKNVGPVSAYVDQTDHANGLTIRASPSEDGRTLGYLPPGTKIRGSGELKSGWVKLISPVDTGWVNIAFLKPRAIEGMVTKVDNTELCLPIRAGPAALQQKVGCAQIGEGLNLTGIMTADNWLQLTDRRGWVDASSVQLPMDAPQAVGTNTVTPSATSLGATAGPSGEKPITNPPPLGSPAKKDLSPEKAPAIPPAATARSTQITAKPPKEATDKGTQARVVTCRGGWCVAFGTGEVTRAGKTVPGIECLKNDVCASIVAQHHAEKAATDGIATFGNFKLLANGVILDLESGKVLVNCNDKGGVGRKCVADFLRKTVTGSAGENKKASASEKAGKPTAKFSKPATAASTSRKPKQESSERPFSSPFFDKDKSDQQVIEDAWEDSEKRMPGGK
jgi:hypothetical protein